MSTFHDVSEAREASTASLAAVGVGIATTLIWPPVFEYLAGH